MSQRIISLMQTGIIKNRHGNFQANKQGLISSEPYVIYSGFKLGAFPNHDALKELSFALKSYYQVVLLIDAEEFSKDLLNFIQLGELASCLESNDSSIYQKASMLVDTSLVYSLPSNATHPALVHIKNSFVQDVNLRVAPRLISTQLESWRLKHERIKAYSRTKLELEVL